jgi:BlaI family penicillinase repressor
VIDELVAWFGGKPLPIMTHLIESGRLTPDEVYEARKALRSLPKKDKSQ